MVGSHIKVWLMLTAAVFLLTPIARTSDTIIGQVEKEVDYAHRHMGGVDADRFVHAANTFFDDSVLRSGLAAIVKRTETPTDIRDQDFGQAPSRAADLARAYGTGLLANFYALVLRVCLAAVWLPVLLPFFLACVFDAFQMRRRKEYNVEYVNPGTYGVGMHALVFMVFFPFLYFVAPFAVTPLLVPVLFLPASMIVHLVVKNSQKVSA